MSRVDCGYCEVMLEWVISWDAITRGRLILEMLFSYEMSKQKGSNERHLQKIRKAYWFSFIT